MHTRLHEVRGLLSRRKFILGSATVFGALLSGCSQAPFVSREKNRSIGQSRQLNIYSWADYLHPDAIPNFEKRYGIRVVYDTFASNESLLAKLQAGASNYDIVVPTSYMVRELIRLGLLSQLDQARIPNLSCLIPRFRDPSFDRGLKHSVPYTWGTTGIGFNRSSVPASAAVPDDLDVFWDRRFAHRITLLDDARETIGMSLKRDGHSFNTKSKMEIEDALNKLKQQKPLTMCYTSDQVITQLAAGDSWVALGYSGDIYQAAKDNPNIQYRIPRSGASIWMDNMCIPVTAPHVENAYKWLNYMLEPEVSAATASYTRYATPNAKALKLISPEMRGDPNLYPNETLMAKCEELGDLGPLVFFYDKMWTELKCT